jgi:hypothetical protein
MNLALKVTGVLLMGLGAYLAFAAEQPIKAASPVGIAALAAFIAGLAMLLMRIAR